MGYFNITVKMLTCKEVLILVGLIFSHAHIEYVVARFLLFILFIFFLHLFILQAIYIVLQD